MLQWYVVSNEVGIILAVYGSALEDMALSKCKELADAFPESGIYLHNIVGNRPSVGGSISMKGQVTRYWPHYISKLG